MPDFHDPSRLLALGHDWIAAWNARDLERVLAMYSDDTEMTSDRIPAFGFGASGTVRGKAELRAYWSAALAKLPEAAFRADRSLCLARQRRGVLPERTRQQDLRVSAAR